MKVLNLYIKIKRTNQTIEILDVRKNGQRTPKKIWLTIFTFFNSVNRDFPVHWWSPCFPYKYNGRVYNIKIASYSVSDQRDSAKIYKMKIYK